MKWTPPTYPTPERVAEAMPDEVSGEQVILALIGLGIPEDVARYANEVEIGTRGVEVQVVTSLRRGMVRMTIPLDPAPTRPPTCKSCPHTAHRGTCTLCTCPGVTS